MPFYSTYGTGSTSGITRGYSATGGPGPTFRMKPGETLNILLRNQLTAAHSVACTTTAGEFCDTATTNLHTHGLHISSKGTEDGLAAHSDNIFAEVAAGGQ